MSLSRSQAARALARVIAGGQSLDRALPAEADAATRALVYETLRHGHRLEFMLNRLLRHPLRGEDGDVRALLLQSLCELTRFRTPDYAVVNGAVATTRKLGKPWAAKLVNAVLRNFLRRRTSLESEADKDGAASVSHPAWLARRIRADWPERAAAVFRAGNAKGPMWLRVNTARIGVGEYQERLAAVGIEVAGTGMVPEALRLATPVEVDALPGFQRGLVSVQDAAAQLAAELLAPEPGQRVLDACCAPGGKTAHLLERAREKLKLDAVERDPERLALVHDNLARLGLSATLIQGDATRPQDWWDGTPYHRILLDAPCSGTGVIRRHPDIKWLRREQDIEAHATLQARLLASLWPLLAPGGRLLYATCSILEAENTDRIEAFVAEHPDAEAVTLAHPWGVASGEGRQILPGEGAMDGFFYALLAKHS